MLLGGLDGGFDDPDGLICLGHCLDGGLDGGFDGGFEALDGLDGLWWPRWWSRRWL